MTVDTLNLVAILGMAVVTYLTRIAGLALAGRLSLGPRAQAAVDANPPAVLDAVRDAVPGAIVVCDSTQAAYAGNLYYDHDRPGGWFNAATGYGALGYGPPAAIGAAIGRPDVPVICIAGDGGMQFTLAELGSAMDEKAGVIFVIWNNHGFQEIESAMTEAAITPVGVRPSAPDFCAIASAYGMASERIGSLGELGEAISRARGGPALIEVGGDPLL